VATGGPGGDRREPVEATPVPRRAHLQKGCAPPCLRADFSRVARTGVEAHLLTFVHPTRGPTLRSGRKPAPRRVHFAIGGAAAASRTCASWRELEQSHKHMAGRKKKQAGLEKKMEIAASIQKQHRPRTSRVGTGLGDRARWMIPGHRVGETTTTVRPAGRRGWLARGRGGDVAGHGLPNGLVDAHDQKAWSRAPRRNEECVAPRRS